MFDEKLVELPAEASNDFVFQNDTTYEKLNEQGKTVNVYNFFNVYPKEEEAKKAMPKPEEEPPKPTESKSERKKSDTKFALKIGFSVSMILAGIAVIIVSNIKNPDTKDISEAVNNPVTVFSETQYEEKYSTAIDLYEDGEYLKAADAFLEILNYGDSWYYHYLCKYDYAVSLVNMGDVETAGKLFLELYNADWLCDHLSEETLYGADYGFGQVTSKSIGYWNKYGAVLTFCFFGDEEDFGGFIFRQADSSGNLRRWIYYDREGVPQKAEFMSKDGYLHSQDLN